MPLDAYDEIPSISFYEPDLTPETEDTPEATIKELKTVVPLLSHAQRVDTVLFLKKCPRSPFAIHRVEQKLDVDSMRNLQQDFSEMEIKHLSGIEGIYDLMLLTWFTIIHLSELSDSSWKQQLKDASLKNNNEKNSEPTTTSSSTSAPTNVDVDDDDNELNLETLSITSASSTSTPPTHKEEQDNKKLAEKKDIESCFVPSIVTVWKKFKPAIDAQLKLDQKRNPLNDKNNRYFGLSVMIRAMSSLLRATNHIFIISLLRYCKEMMGHLVKTSDAPADDSCDQETLLVSFMESIILVAMHQKEEDDVIIRFEGKPMVMREPTATTN